MHTPLPIEDELAFTLGMEAERRMPPVRKRQYVLHLVFFWILLSVVDVGIEQRTEYGLMRVERLWRGSNIFAAAQPGRDMDPEAANYLGVSREELATGQAVSEAWLNHLDGQRSSLWNRALLIPLGQGRLVIGLEVVFNVVPAFFFAVMFYLRDRQKAAERVIEHQNRVYQQLNRALERRVIESAHIIETLNTMKHKLVEAEKLASIGRMSATLAHEIRNPLTIIKSSLDFVREDIEGETGSHAALGLMRDEINRMDRIISDLLNFSRPKPPCIEHHDLKLLVRHWLPPIVEELERERIQLVPQLDEPGQVAVDPDQLYQVFLNVMWNARDALRGQPNPHVFVRTEEGSADFISLVIQDTGPGMIPDVQAQVFEPFFTTKTQGTGLGMSVSLQLIEAMNGRLRIESELEVGTTVRLSLPRAGSRMDRQGDWTDALLENPAERSGEA